MLGDHERRFKEKSVDADVPADGFDLNYAGTGVRLEAYWILQIEAAMLALLCGR